MPPSSTSPVTYDTILEIFLPTLLLGPKIWKSFPPTWLLGPTRLLIYEKISHLHCYWGPLLNRNFRVGSYLAILPETAPCFRRDNVVESGSYYHWFFTPFTDWIAWSGFIIFYTLRVLTKVDFSWQKLFSTSLFWNNVPIAL